MSMDRIDALLEAERGRPGFTPEQRDALWKGIELAMTGAAAAGASAGVAASAATASKKIAMAKLAGLATVAALGGAGVGAAAHARWAEPKVVTVERIVEKTVVAAPPPIADAPAEKAVEPAPTAAASIAPKRVAPKASASTQEPARDPGLARERTLLDMARTALSRGDSTAALAAVDEHARDFPSSQLAEEREVLAIQALVAARRMPEARRRAAAFRTAHPKSPLLPIVDEVTQ